MTVKQIDDVLDLNETQEKFLAQILELAEEEKVEINSLADLKDLLAYLEEKASEFPELNKVQLGILSNKVEEAVSKGLECKPADKTEPKKTSEPKKAKDSEEDSVEKENEQSQFDKTVSKTAKQVAKTTAGTVGRQVGKTVGEALGGSFGKTLGGNVGAELFRSIIQNFGKK